MLASCALASAAVNTFMIYIKNTCAKKFAASCFVWGAQRGWCRALSNISETKVWCRIGSSSNDKPKVVSLREPECLSHLLKSGMEGTTLKAKSEVVIWQYQAEWIWCHQRVWCEQHLAACLWLVGHSCPHQSRHRWQFWFWRSQGHTTGYFKWCGGHIQGIHLFKS